MGAISAALESGRGNNQHTKVDIPGGGTSKREALASAGIDIRRANEAEKLAAIPDAEFDAPFVNQSIANTARATLARYGGVLFDPMTDAIERFIERRGAFLVREFSAAQRDAINLLVRRAALTDTMTVDELARAIRPCIGLTKSQAQAAFNYYEQRRMDYFKQYVDSGMDAKAAATKAAKEALARQATYEGKLHRKRAADIAVTELAFAYNNGMEEVIREGIEDGVFPDFTYRKWSTSADERVCPTCGALDGVVVGMDEDFPGGIPLPPAHPSCRCAVEYVFGEGFEIAENPDKFKWLEDATREQKQKFLGGKNKAALYDAGLLDEGDYFKPLNEITQNDIIIPSEKRLTHSDLGYFTGPSPEYKNGQLGSGGHGQAAIVEMSRRGIRFDVTKTYANGVRTGYVEECKNKMKTVDGFQSWFPESWTREDIRTAGIYTANKGSFVGGKIPGQKEAVWRGVRVQVIIHEGVNIGTIYPTGDQ
jgi:SPP1 gp7 family putative phage head morphogenesis protein